MEQATENAGPVVGMRVIALAEADEKAVQIYGRGTYVGDEVPGEDVPGPRTFLARLLKVPVPKVQLDSGKAVFATECHLGPEEGFTEFVGERELKEVDIDADRQEAREQEAAARARKQAAAQNQAPADAPANDTNA